MITCREFVEFLMDYLSGELPEDRRSSFDLHLASCSSCVAYMKSYAEAVKMGKAAFADLDELVPAEVPEDLVKAIIESRRAKS